MEADDPRHFVDLRRRQPQSLAEVADDAARAVGGKGGDQGRAVGAVDLVDAGDQDLADVAGEVEVDVGDRGRTVAEEAAGEEFRLDRVDVGEAGQVADDRADAGASPAAGRQDFANRATAANLERDVAGQLEQVVVEEEEAGEAEVADRRQLPGEAGVRLVPVGAAGVAIDQPMAADLGQGVVGVLLLGVAVAEFPGEVELEPLGEPHGLRHRLGVLGEAGGHQLGRGQRRAAVAAAPRLRLLQRLPPGDGDEGVLQAGAAAAVGMDVAGGDGGEAEARGEQGEPAVAGAVVTTVGPLQLDPQALAAEGLE